MPKPSTDQILKRAMEAKTVVPAFNIPYLPMMEPVVRALRDAHCFGLVVVARLEWIKFEAQSPAAVRDEYQRLADPRHTRLPMDHVPVIDEDNLRVDALAELTTAVQLGYESVMIDGSRLDLDENISATREVVRMAHDAGVAVVVEGRKVGYRV